MINRITIRYSSYLERDNEVANAGDGYWNDLRAFIYDNTTGLVSGQDFNVEFEQCRTGNYDVYGGDK